jgi:hypothetical protein
MKNNCLHCHNEFSGREGKLFCGTPCKNTYNNERRKKTITETQTIDGYLHRNHEILSELCAASPTNKLFFAKSILVAKGFKFEYLTGIYLNNQGKMYHYVYNFAWMVFSDEQVMVVIK